MCLPGSVRNHPETKERAVTIALVNALVEQGEYRPARRLLGDAAKKGPPALALALMRLHLTFGAIEAAENALALSEKRGASSEALILHRGFLALAKGDHGPAADLFTEALSKEAGNVTAATNLALCLLYSKQLVRAVETLENVIRAEPCKAMTYPAVFNLCTLYDLQGGEGHHKKQMMRSLVKMFAPEDFDVAACKL
ncbi:hypothetical protein T484DRAFT_1881938 [Baffinella frigidus]|nr:hypothetical protein T484DRAFT_1881938 [Cryptophyta sp. CCMP2293]